MSIIKPLIRAIKKGIEISIISTILLFFIYYLDAKTNIPDYLIIVSAIILILMLVFVLLIISKIIRFKNKKRRP